MRWLYWFFSPILLLLIISQPLFSAEPKEPKRVLVLCSEDRDNPGQLLTEQGIREGFGSDKRFDIKIYFEYLDASRFSDPSHVSAMGDLLRRKYSGAEMNVIITVYPYALGFLLAERQTLFRDTPIIAAAITRNHAESLERSPVRRLVTGVFAGNDVAGLLETALWLCPKTKRVAIISGSSPNDASVEEQYRADLKPYTDRLALIDLTKLSLEETLSRVGSLPPGTLVFFSSMFKDGTGKNLVNLDALSSISRASNAPVFGFSETYLGLGVVGGRLVSFTKHGREAAALALRIMQGESPASIPFAGEEAYVSVYDWRELKRWGISEQDLPPGSTVEFKSFTIWEQHRKTIIGGLIFMAFESLLIIGLVVNLLKRRQAESEIAASSLRYQTVADYTYGWEYWSAPNGELKYISPSCQRITGYSVSQFTEDPSLFLNIIVPEDREIWDKHEHEDHSHLQPREIQFRIRNSRGELRWIDHTCFAVTDPQGEFLGIRSSNRDITQRKKAEFEAQQHRNELSHLTRVAAMGELTSSLAHELNQPLAAIRNYAYAAQRFLARAESEKAKEALEGIIRDDRRAVEVISGVRGLLKKEEPRCCPVHVNDVVQEALVFIRSDSVLEGLKIETDLAPGLPNVQGDPVQVQQVLLNLMLNALDAMKTAKPDSRKLVIKTENEKNGQVKVSVKDLGPGVDEARLEKLFEPFYTTKPAGLGMGLAISARIIHAHGGTVWCENNLGGGATFFFTLQANDSSKRPHPV